MSIYFLPSISAITLGEIKSDKQNGESVKKSADLEPLNKKKSDEKKSDKLPEKKVESDNKKDGDKVNPRLVCLLSVIMPGGGHFYLNKDMKGLGFCLTAGAGYTAAGFFMIKTMLTDAGSTDYINYLLLTGFLFYVSLIIHFVGIIDY